MSPSQFADVVGLNRSAISHVLNNRNKPGYDFMQKVHRAYPAWDFDWLMFDQKATPKRKVSVPTSAPIPAPEPKPLPQEHRVQAAPQGPNYSQGSLFSEPEPRREGAQTPTIRKQVTKTILIYSDGTFEIYQNNLQ